MRPVSATILPGQQLVMYAADQPQYNPLPSLVDSNGVVTTEWELSAEELEMLLQGGRLRLRVHTFHSPLQPVTLNTVPPECGMRTPAK